MNAFLSVAALFLVCILFCELLLQRGKLQSRLWRVLAAHACFMVAGMICLHRLYQIGPSSIFVFWIGAFLTWFGIRSHIESSILLRMIFLLSHEPMRAEQLVQHYAAHYNSALRLTELERAGLLNKEGDQLQITRKGEWVLRMARLLNPHAS